MLIGYLRVSNRGDRQVLDLQRSKPRRCRPGRRRQTGILFPVKPRSASATRGDYRFGRSAVFNTKASRTPALLSWVATSRVAMAT